jgi:predicted PurR-regulated permease PerM
MNGRPEELDTPQQEYGANWSQWARRLAVIILLIGTVFAATLLGSVLSNVIVAFILAFALFFAVRALTRRFKIPYTSSVILVFGIYVLLAFSLATSLLRSVVPFVSSLTVDGRETAETFLEFLQQYEPGDAVELGFQGEIARIADTVFQPMSDFVKSFDLRQVGDVLPTLLGTAGNAAESITGALGSIFLVHLLALLFLLEIPNLLSWGQTIVAPEYRRETAILLNKIGQVWVGYMRGQVIVASLIGLLTTIQLLILGIPDAILIGVFTAIVSLIPLLGGFVALGAIFLVTLLNGSSTLELDMLTLLLLTVGINLVMQQIIWNVVSPRVTGEAVNLPVPIIILGLIIGSQIGGLLGALLAAPVMGILRVIVIYVLRKVRGGDPYPDEPEPAWITTGMFMP